MIRLYLWLLYLFTFLSVVSDTEQSCLLNFRV